ncbi:MAG TPA: hypothetical protein VH255_00475 [Verrucomicrobiae bacterium]|nr:hypothetical protein [Verrucomicrobiae bacterium]
MKTSTITIGLACLLGISAGCVQREVVYRNRPAPPPVAVTAPPTPSGDLVVNAEPPPPQNEVIVASPGPGYVWTRGYWEWHGHWAWVGGRWIVGPRPGAIWVEGRWAPRRGRYVYVRGYWR